MFEFKENERINYPLFTIVNHDKKIIITTKKIGSRYFEDLSRAFINGERVGDSISVDVRLIDNLNNTYDYELFGLNGIERLEKFMKSMGKNNISDLFVFDKILFITRHPMSRFYSGFFEKVDSIYVCEGENYTPLNKKTQYEIDKILNKHVELFDYNIFSDEHTSLWNTFLIEFINKMNIKDKIEVIDLNDINKMDQFGKLGVNQPTNRHWLINWISNPANKSYIDTLYNKFKFYFDLEIKSYNSLLDGSYG